MPEIDVGEPEEYYVRMGDKRYKIHLNDLDALEHAQDALSNGRRPRQFVEFVRALVPDLPEDVTIAGLLKIGQFIVAEYKGIFDDIRPFVTTDMQEQSTDAPGLPDA